MFVPGGTFFTGVQIFRDRPRVLHPRKLFHHVPAGQQVSCREALLCNFKCQNKTEEQACNILFELTYGYNSTKYRSLMQCMNDHSCLPKSPPDGVCLANNTNTNKNSTDIAQAKGKWWICGQPWWPAGFDYFPCQRDEFVLEDGHWIVCMPIAVAPTIPALCQWSSPLPTYR